MPLRIENTHEWDQARMSQVLPSVVACIRKFVAEFPDEVSEEFLIAEVMMGRRQLWVVYDEANPNVALLAVVTENKQYEATGVAFVEIVGIGGERIRSALPLIQEIENWAAARGAQHSMIIGRFGWKQLLKERGYQPKAVILKKALRVEAHGQQ